MLAKVSPTKTLAALSFVFAAASAFVIDSDGKLLYNLEEIIVTYHHRDSTSTGGLFELRMAASQAGAEPRKVSKFT